MQLDQRQAQMLTGSRFGQRKGQVAAATVPSSIARDLRLFACTFAGGFLFMTIYLG